MSFIPNAKGTGAVAFLAVTGITTAPKGSFAEGVFPVVSAERIKGDCVRAITAGGTTEAGWLAVAELKSGTGRATDFLGPGEPGAGVGGKGGSAIGEGDGVVGEGDGVVGVGDGAAGEGDGVAAAATFPAEESMERIMASASWLGETGTVTGAVCGKACGEPACECADGVSSSAAAAGEAAAL